MKIIMLGLFFLSLFALAYAFYKFANTHNIQHKAVIETENKNFYNVMRNVKHKEVSESGLIYNLDIMLEQSNLKKYFKHLSVNSYIVASIVGFMVGMMVMLMSTSNIIFGFIAGSIVVLGMFIILMTLADINYKKIDKQLVNLANILGNYNKTSDDIFTIFDSASYYLNEPLRTPIQECVREARADGDAQLALTHLRLRVNHRKFQNMIRQLENCSKYSSDYSPILERQRQQLQSYNKVQQERKAILSNCKLQILTLLGVSVAVFAILQTLMESNIFYTLFRTQSGNMIVLLDTVLFGGVIMLFVMLDKKFK